jgi:hypothetical protein
MPRIMSDLLEKTSEEEIVLKGAGDINPSTSKYQTSQRIGHLGRNMLELQWRYFWVKCSEDREIEV